MAITDLINSPSNINKGLNSAKQITMISLLDNPRGGNYDQTCRAITDARLKKLVVTRDVGQFRVTGLSPAVDSLEKVLEDVHREQREVFAGLGTAERLCARFVRNSTTDGEFGRATHAAVMAFQAANGLTVDGLVGKNTRQKLGF